MASCVPPCHQDLGRSGFPVLSGCDSLGSDSDPSIGLPEPSGCLPPVPSASSTGVLHTFSWAALLRPLHWEPSPENRRSEAPTLGQGFSAGGCVCLNGITRAVCLSLSPSLLLGLGVGGSSPSSCGVIR